ncbi:MAG: DEAD/DEAH box helicase [Methylovulum sp.]|uniref:DEAD/DEAH box helicase n=1 Tax=Methylovulum sp. TaxID=1916980 RepID=UPI002610798B|nr:DEAD/DEAH box helicase [Methylovulum sp.]MDD2724528.1 DEAD/DEAH box helicase [Methylovulum sp.]MDD5124041.1 DEAD/DEAH box helicase [Methylovulum sp.]
MTNLPAIFNTLPPAEKDIVMALSVIYAPVSQANFQNLLSKSASFDAKTVRLVDKQLKERLHKSKLIIANNDGWSCHPAISEALMRSAVDQPWFKKLAPLLIADTGYYPSHRVIACHIVKQLRLFLYQGSVTACLANIDRLHSSYPEYFAEHINRVFFTDFDGAWFTGLPVQIQYGALKYLVVTDYKSFTDVNKAYQLLEQLFGGGKPAFPEIAHTLIEQRLLRGNFQDAKSWLADDPSSEGLKIRATICFLQNHNDEAINLFNAALKQLKKETSKRNITLYGLHGYFFSLALLRSRTGENLAYLKKQHLPMTLKKGYDAFYEANALLDRAVDVYQAKVGIEEFIRQFKSPRYPYEYLFQALIFYWLVDFGAAGKNIRLNFVIEQLAKYCPEAHKSGYLWYAAVGALLLQRLDYKNAECQQLALHYIDTPFGPILDLLPKASLWERALTALTQLSGQPLAATQPQPELRLIWSISLEADSVVLVPKEQRLGKNGQWSKGRPVALKKLYHDLADYDYLTEQDRKICTKIAINKESDYYGYYAKEVYELSIDGLLATAGHPHVYWAGQEQSGKPVDISIAEPQLLVKEELPNLRMFLVPEINRQRVIAQKTANHGLILYVINDQHRQVAEILGKDGLVVPASARQQVIDSIASIASMLTVQSDIGGTSNAIEAPVDSRLHIHLQPMGQGIQIEVFVQPFANGGPLYKPGNGGATVLADIDGQQYQTTRDFGQENAYVMQLLAECPELYKDRDFKWFLDDPEIALEALLHFQDLGDFAVLEWPKGKKIKLSREAGLSQAYFSVRKEKDWFSVDGDLVVDDDQIFNMQRLMHLLGGSSSRFLKLEDGQIIALTRELRQRLDDLAGLGEMQDDKIRFHPLAVQALDNITEGMSLTASKPWKDQLNYLNKISDLNPQVPSTLQGELRDYQREGFQWMSRLAHWGAGACLADDMGLGKTVQALALILSRAPAGPTLILAPTSVCINWLEEAQRFAPTLNVQHFGYGDRQAMLDNVGEFDLVICSYGLLQTEAGRLAQVHWHTLVADEAQAIKNALTKRSKAAMTLQADFKLITTGTPIENHLGELWNLFNFINPGLLGSLSRFNERYANAIENQQDHAVQQRLKKLLRPFILRRLKNDVLTELPPRTEVTLHIELSADERAMYEALRRSALKSISDAAEEPGSQQLKVLAEIMKLRRACCNPRLVMEESPIKSSKLQAFEELVDELLDNRHKALVFSQFVGHLDLIRELLDKKGISYHYLDGSTPVPQRKKAMNAFQAGDGDLFLISLKAGGTGLNLTAADYVIHMDPWWNPAVEDQASDRAHRMGQKRPVTIYRLVAKDTIEDKIVDLHKHKRDLANSLLEGGEVSGKMSVSDMMALISDMD